MLIVDTYYDPNLLTTGPDYYEGREYNEAFIDYTSQEDSASFVVDEPTRVSMTTSTLEAVESFDRPAMLSVLGGETTLMEEVLTGI